MRNLFSYFTRREAVLLCSSLLLFPDTGKSDQFKFREERVHIPSHGVPFEDHREASHRFDPRSLSDTVLQLTGRWARGACTAVDVSGKYAYVGSGDSFLIVDISDSGKFLLLGELTLEANLQQIHVRDSMAYVVIPGGLEILDVSRADAIESLSRIAIGPEMEKIVLDGQTAFLTNRYGWLFVVDISNPRSPVLKHASNPVGEYPWLAVKSGYVYMGSPWDRVVIAVVNATNPDTPRVHYVDNPGYATVFSEAIRDTFLLAGSAVFSIANPDTPKLLGEASTVLNSFSHLIDDDIAYIADDFNGIVTMDFSDPYNPTVVGRWRFPFHPLLSRSMTKQGSTLYASIFSGLVALNLSIPESLIVVGYLPTGGDALDVHVQNNTAYISTTQGVVTVDVRDPGKPSTRSVLQTGWATGNAIARDSLLYIYNAPYGLPGTPSDTLVGLWIADVSVDSVTPKILSHYQGIARKNPGPGTPTKITRSGDLILMTQSPYAGPPYTVEVIDVSKPISPRRAGAVLGEYRPYDIALKGSIAFIATADSGVRIVDLHQTDNPKQVGVVQIAPVTWAVAVKDTFLFLHAGLEFFILSISNPLSPVFLSSLPLNATGFAEVSLSVSGNYLYSSGGSYLGVIDVSDPLHPVTVEQLGELYFPASVFAIGNNVYLSYFDQGVWIFRNNRITSVEQPTTTALPKTIHLYQNYPNPFNSLTKIEFDIPTSDVIDVSVFNILGQKIQTLITGTFVGGRHPIVFDAANLPSGIYYYRVSTSHSNQTRKMVLSK